MLKRFLIGDKIIILVTVLLSLSTFLIFPFWNKTESSYAEVYSDGGLLYQIDLSVDKEYKVETEFGLNIIKVENGKIGIIHSDCFDHICEKEGFKNKSGDTIICLPNRLVIVIKNSIENDVDDISS